MAEREIPNRMTALGLLEQIRRSNANREPEFNPVNASIRERREAPLGSLFGGQRQPPLPVPPTPPRSVPRQAEPLPTPPIPPAVIPQAEGGTTPTHERFNLQNPYVATAVEMAERYGLPRNVFLSLLQQESRFDPNAVSRAGALGLGQLMPGTARELGVDPTNPTQNIEGSARYLRQQLDRFGGDMPLALAAYNAGPRRVAEAGNAIPDNPETQAYVPAVMRRAGMPGYAKGGLAHLEQKYADGGPVASLPTFDYHVRANRIRTPRAPRPAPREELTANQLNDMVLDRIAGRAAPAMEAAPAAEARDRIGQVMGYSEGGLSISGGGAETNTGNARILGYSGTAGLNARLGREGGQLDTSITGQGMSSHAGGRHRQHHRVEGANLNYTTPQGDRFTLGYHDQQMAMPDRLPGADPMEVHRGAPSRGVRLGFSREFAEGGLAELEHKYEGGGPVSMLTGLARRAMRRSPPAPRPDEIPMIATHNAREIGLQKIAENGGEVVAPSIGISRVDEPMDSFGEISLIASPQTVDPRRTPVYGRDAYTPRYPSVIPMTVRGQEKDYVRLYNDNTGETRLLPHTPKNALRVMTNDPWRGGENFITDNWLLGQITPQFRNMSELRGARDRLVPRTDKSVEDWQNQLGALRQEFRDVLPDSIRDNFNFIDSHTRNMAEAAQRGPGGMEYINRTYYGNAIPPSLLERTTLHLNAGRDLPTTYFEAKPRRVVPLSEFEGAVVPQQASKDVTDMLRRYGVNDIHYYNQGDVADRAAQIRQFERLMFGAAPVAAGAAVASEGEGAPSLDELDQRYAEGGSVMSDEEYDRRLLGRMQRDMGRTDVPSWDEQRDTLVDAAGRAARGVFDVVVPQTPLDVGLTLATGPGVGSMMRRAALAGAGYLLDPDEAQANVIRRVGRALGRAGAGAADTALEAAATPVVAPTRRRGTIGIIPEETAPAARVTQDVEGYRPNIDPVTGRAILPAAEDLLAAPRSDFPYLDVPQPSNARQNQALLAEQQNMTPGTGNTYSGNMDPLVNERVTFRGREPREWSPSDWGAFGRQYGTDRLGPMDDAAWQSSLREYNAGGGQRIIIPGGLETDAPFTYYDQLFLKSQGIDPSQMPRDMHIALQRRILNSVTPDADDPVAAYNGLMMGFASPNNPLFPNQIAMTRLRARSPEDIERLADMLPWQAGDDVSKADRAAFNRRIAEVYGLDAGPQAAVTARDAVPRVPGRRAREAVVDENGRVIQRAQPARAARNAKPAREAEEATIGGTGARGSPDYTRIAEFAQMYRDRPDFFRFNPDPNLSNSENWSRFVERIVSQVPGLSAKTGSFGAVWQQPATAAISAIDRHMANQIGSRIFPDRQALDKFNERVITKWNSSLTPAQRKTDRVSDIEELTNNDRGNTFLQGELLNAVGQHSGMRVRNPRGGLNPDLPSHLTPEEANWVREPRNVATLGSHYREALSENARMAEREGLGLFGSQWLNWDRIRRRLEPHENMNPVLSRIPPMALEQLQDARLTHRAMGSTDYTKVRPTPEQEAAALRAGDNVNASPRLKPTSRVANPSGLGYFAAPPLVAGSLAREGEAAPSLEELDQRYAEGGSVMSDAEYDRRLLARMKRDTGRTTESTNAEQIQALRNAGHDAAQLASDIFLPQSPLDAALMVAMGPGPRMARLVGSAALAAMEPSEAQAIISPRTARSLRMATRIPEDTRFRRAVEATPGASITDDGLSLEVLRHQKPEQAGEQAIREGVFYLPATLPSRSVGTYWGTSASTYGGPDLVRGETLLRAPLAMPGNTGGVVPERAFRELTSDANMRRLERESRSAAAAPLLGAEYRENIENFLNQWGGNPNVAHELVSNSRKGNRMRYALQEHVIGNRARQEGYDSIVGTGARTPRITEVFDLREAAYPVPGSPEFEMLLPHFEDSRYAQGGLAQLNHKYAEGGAVSAQPAIYDPDAVNALANQIEAGYV
jgi:hypothetical protein